MKTVNFGVFMVFLTINYVECGQFVEERLNELISENKFDSPDVITLAYQAKVQNLNSLKEKFPKSIQNMIWHDVCIKNVHYESFLIAEENSKGSFKAPNNDQKLFVLTNKNKLINNAWKLETDDQGLTFTIRSTKTGDYLSSTSRKFDSWGTYRKCDMNNQPENASKWTIMPVDSASKFMIKNHLYRENLFTNYLYKSNDRQFVCTTDISNHFVYWTFEAC